MAKAIQTFQNIENAYVLRCIFFMKRHEIIMGLKI